MKCLDVLPRVRYINSVRRLFYIVFLIVLPTALFASEQDVLREIRHLREDMNKRFEQVDKRFEQVDKRFEFIQAILIALITLSIGTPVALEYFARRRSQQDERNREEVRKVIFALREIAEKDPKVDRASRHAGLL